MSLRSSRLRNVHRFSAAVTLGGLGVLACSSRPAPDAEGARVRSAAEALGTTSCQALDIAVKKDATETGGTTYAIDTSGKVFGWGANKDPAYPLGSRTLGTQVTTPVYLNVDGASRLAAGKYGACAIVNNATDAGVESGAVKCWGFRTGSAQVEPTIVTEDDTGADLTGVTAIAAGDNHVCALKSDTTVWCWGDDTYGQLGDDTQGGPAQPGLATAQATRMLNMVGVSQIAAAGSSTCVLHTLPSGVGEVACLGDNQLGQLGQGTMGEGTFEPVPTPIVLTGTIPSFGAIYGGGKGTFCASTAAGISGPQTTYCWGANDHAQAAIVNHLATPGPFQVSTDVGAAWAQGDLNGCEVSSPGNVSCWGGNNYGEVPGAAPDAGPEVDQSTAVAGLTGAFKVSIGETHICALASGALACWGRNADGEIGSGTTGDATPVTNVFLSTPDIACGAGAVGDPCGVFTNACGSKDCGTCGPLNSCDGTTQKCKDDPNKCAPACGAGLSCVQHACLPYCVAQAPDTTIALARPGFSVTSPATYGANACGGYILEVTNAGSYLNEMLTVGPATRPTTDAACTSLRIDLSYFANGAQLGTTTTVHGTWDTSTGYCTFGNLSSVGIWTKMPRAADLRIVADVQQSVLVGKTVSAWQNVPLTISLFGQCQDGVQDGDETGVDCGGECRPCRCPAGTHDCGDGKCVKTACP